MPLVASAFGKFTHIPMLAWTLATFFGFGFACLALLAFKERRLLKPHQWCGAFFPAEHWKKGIVRLDILFYFFSKITDRIFAVVPATITVVLAGFVAQQLQRYVPLNAHHVASIPILIALAFAFFIAVDLANYITHLLQHKVPFLWELHKVHHSALFLSPLTTARMHPLGNEFDGLLAAILVSAPVGFAVYYYNLSTGETAAMVVSANLVGTLVVLDALRHSQFPISFGPFDKVLMSPHMHQLHHSTKREHWDKNLGNKLSLWDWLFGTAFAPVKGEPITYGIGTIDDVRGDYATLYGCYIGPLVKIWQMFRRWLHGKSLTQADKDALVLHTD